MLRRTFLAQGLAMLVAGGDSQDAGVKLAKAALAQLGVTTGYDPNYTKIAYPMGDVPRSTGVCADVVVRAGRDALGLDLQRLVHEDMAAAFSAYPKTWGTKRTDTNIDHRRVLNLETYFRRSKAEVWFAPGATSGDAFPKRLEVGDIVTWRLDARLPHIGVIVEQGWLSPRVVHHIGGGVQENALFELRSHRAMWHYRWLG